MTIHRPECTWRIYEQKGLSRDCCLHASLEYGWCHSFCERTDVRDIDYDYCYQSAYGDNYSLLYRSVRLMVFIFRWSWASRWLKNFATGGTVTQWYEHRRYNFNRGLRP